MRIVAIIACCLLLICLSCEKAEDSICPDGLEAGRIIGQDFRKCVCCSGWWIEIGTDTLRTFVLPKDIKIDDTNIVDGISVPVCLSYKKSTDCSDWEELIEVEEMILQ